MKTYPTEVVLSISTGRLLCRFSDMHELIEYISGQPIFTHMLASKALSEALSEAIFKQHPQLREIDSKSINTDNWEQKKNELIEKFGPSLEIAPGI